LAGVTFKEAESPTNVAAETTPAPGALTVPSPMAPMAGGGNVGGIKPKGPGAQGPPTVGGPAEGKVVIQPRPLKDYGKPFMDRVLGKLNPFNVYGVVLDLPEQGKQGYPGGVPGAFNPMPGGAPSGFMPEAVAAIKRPGVPTPPTSEGSKGDKPASGLD